MVVKIATGFECVAALFWLRDSLTDDCISSLSLDSELATTGNQPMCMQCPFGCRVGSLKRPSSYEEEARST